MTRTMKMLLSATAIAAMTALSGCGETVEIPSGYVGKLSTADGLSEGIIQPSKLRLSTFCLTCDSVILAQATDETYKEQMKIFIPQDQLNLSVDVRTIVSISSDQANVEKVFARSQPQKTENSRVSVIPQEGIYVKYAQPVIREAVRTLFARHNIEYIMNNREKIKAEVRKILLTKFASSPLTLIDFTLADIQPPEVIVAKQEQKKQREIEVERAEADKLVRLAEAQGNLEVAKKQQEIDLLEAETQAKVEKVLADAVSEAFVTQRALRILDTMAASPNKVFFMPQEAFVNPEMLLGAMFQTDIDGEKE